MLVSTTVYSSTEKTENINCIVLKRYIMLVSNSVYSSTDNTGNKNVLYRTELYQEEYRHVEYFTVL